MIEPDHFCECRYGLWILPIRAAIVTDSTLRLLLNSYDCHLETLPEENEMMFKMLRFSLSTVLVACSLFAVGAVVFG